MSSPDSIELLQELGQVDPTLLTGVVDTSPSLSSWMSIEPTAEDFKLVVQTLGVAYDASVYSATRMLPEAQRRDLPVGAAIADPSTGMFFPGFASDQETGDPSAHAEPNAIRHAQDLGYDVGGLTLASTLEPCPSCLHTIEEAGIARVTYGAGRSELESIGIVKPHSIKAAEIVKAGRIASATKFPFEFFQFPNRAIQAACLEVFAAYRRDPETEEVTVDDSFMESTRFNVYHRITEEELLVPISESELILRNFRQVLEGFYRNPPAITY